MGDYLDVVVQRCKQAYERSELVLSKNGTSDIQFRLPISIHLRKGDIIQFYQGIIRGLENPTITHDDYLTAEIYRRNKWRKKELVARLESADMRLLENVKRDYKQDYKHLYY
nr:hypothetical protein [Candidatus Woesearchaeota archaeon]